MPPAAPSCALFIGLFSAAGAAGATPDPSLAIVDAGVQQGEDAPFAPAGYRFLPGDSLYFTFQIAGFGIQSGGRDELRKISLHYEITPQDASGVALVTPATGSIATELSPEDKNWTPKRRSSFLLPSFIAAGEFRVHVALTDEIGKVEVYKDFPFRIGGVALASAESVTLQDFRFLRGEEDREALEVPAYGPGDTVYARFEMTGFKIGPQNQHHLSYGISVLRPDGKPFVEEAKAAELAGKTFYPAQYLPGNINITTSIKSPRGRYLITVTAHDAIANTSSQLKRSFSIE